MWHGTGLGSNLRSVSRASFLTQCPPRRTEARMLASDEEKNEAANYGGECGCRPITSHLGLLPHVPETHLIERETEHRGLDS